MSAAAPEAHAAVAIEVARAGTSFFWAMRLLPAPKRRGMFAVYAFCRAVDDIADDPALPAPLRRERLDAWRRALDGRPVDGLASDPVRLALEDARAAFGLPREELLAVIEGVAMDAERDIVAPPLDDLLLYCRRVAGAVGVLTLHVLGRPDAHALGPALGLAFQLTNILRDLEEDARRGRLYVPCQDLRATGVPAGVPADALDHPAFADAFARVLARARAGFAEARALWIGLDPSGLRPVAVMWAPYLDLLDRIERAGWPRDPASLRAGRLAKAGLVVRALLRPGG